VIGAEHDTAIQRAERCFEPIPGMYQVISHGTEDAVCYKIAEGHWQAFSAQALARLIAAQPDYDGQKIYLVACCAGMLREGLAQQLANALCVMVLAPTERVWLHADHTSHIGPDAWTKTGYWQPFWPR
jgi:hypothetical protein